MAASAALAGLTGCTKLPTQHIVPYVRQPEDILAGQPIFYATAMTLGGVASGILVESHMGRPTKIEGNPDHPASLGATDVFTQAAVLSLYDPDRSQAVVHDGRIGSWNEFQRELAIALEEQKTKKGAGLRILTETHHFSVARGADADATLRVSGRAMASIRIGGPRYGTRGREAGLRRICEHGLSRRSGASDSGARFGFSMQGSGMRALRARVCANAGARKATMSRLYAVEATPTNTGAMADHRLRLRASEIESFARDCWPGNWALMLRRGRPFHRLCLPRGCRR